MSGVRVPGTGYRYGSADEALADAERMEALAEAEVSDLREAGREAEADRRADRWAREIQRVRDAARAGQERDAKETPQPADRPHRSRRELARRALKGRTRPRTRSIKQGTTGRILRQSGATGAGRSATATALGIFGAVIGIAFLIVILEAERAPGSRFSGLDTFQGLADGIVRALGVFVGPYDPLDRQAWTGPPADAPTAPAPRERSARPGRPATVTRTN